MTPEQALAIQAQAALWQVLAAGAQAVFALVLVAVTVWYAVSTRAIANETRLMARATSNMLEQARAQQLAQARPVLVFRPGYRRSGSGISASGFIYLELANIGTGPALDLAIQFVHEVRPEWEIHFTGNHGASLVALGAGEVGELQPVYKTPGFIWLDPTRTAGRLAPERIGRLEVHYHDAYGSPFWSESELFFNEGVESEDDWDEAKDFQGFFLRPTAVSQPGASTNRQ